MGKSKTKNAFWAWMVAAALLPACSGNNSSGSGDTDTDADTDSDSEAGTACSPLNPSSIRHENV